MDFIHVKTISEFYNAVGLGKPKHPLIGIYSFDSIPHIDMPTDVRVTLGYYVITLKKDCTCKWKYGQSTYDYDEGLMGFLAPKQTIGLVETGDFVPCQNGWCLMVHPDFLLGYELARKIKQYQFFFYEVNEALILSEDEENEINDIFKKIHTEINRPIDKFSQDVLVSQLDLLLTYSNRFYNRQFITRKAPHSDLLTKFEVLLHQYFNSGHTSSGLPPVSYFAEKLNLSSKYLSDVLISLTGQSTQIHIHEKLIEKAKEKLSATNLTVSEIAYELGFEHSQSFSKLFKSKVGQSPVEFRVGFN